MRISNQNDSMIPDEYFVRTGQNWHFSKNLAAWKHENK